MGGWVGVSVGVRGGSVLVNACQCHFLSFAYFFLCSVTDFSRHLSC